MHYGNAACWSLVHLGCTVPTHRVEQQVVIADTGGSPGSSFVSGKVLTEDLIPKVKPREKQKSE